MVGGDGSGAAESGAGEVDVEDATVRIVAYDDSWPSAFRQEAERITAVLGERASRVEHVGSTAVPGLPAKPVIDIVVAVADSADEAAYVGDLESAGFVLRVREPDWFEHRLLDRVESGLGVNLHVFTVGCSEIERMLAFRDHLRADADDRLRYASVKQDLARRSWKKVQDYADAKDTIVDEIHRRIDSNDRPDAGDRP